MKSYTTLRNDYGKYTQNTTAANLTQGDIWINDGHKKALKAAPHLREKTTTLSTTASTAYVALPYDHEQTLEGVKVVIGNTNYPVKPAPSREFFNRVSGTNITSDYAEWFFIEPSSKRIYLAPTPSTSRSNVLTLPYKRRVKDLSVADYTTGSVSATNASTTLTGSGTTWTAKMAGRFIRLTDGDATSTGDGEWYEISSVTNATTIVLVQAYNGTTVSGSSYAIGQMPQLPEDFQDLPSIYAAWRYWFSKTGEEARERTAEYKSSWTEGLEELRKQYGNRTTSVVLDDGMRSRPVNPNLFLTL